MVNLDGGGKMASFYRDYRTVVNAAQKASMKSVLSLTVYHCINQGNDVTLLITSFNDGAQIQAKVIANGSCVATAIIGKMGGVVLFESILN